MPLQLKQLRPKQWIKNLLIGLAPFGAGVTSFDSWIRLGLGFISFSLMASCLYIINDFADLEADRAHPDKVKRPLASGELSVKSAVLSLIILGIIGIGIGAVLDLTFLLVLGLYALNTLIYTFWGKEIPIVDLLQVSAGFVARLVAGAVIIDVDVSPWFLTVSVFGSLLIITGKRSAEKKSGVDLEQTRPSITGVSEHFLSQVVGIASSCLVLSYALWSLDAVKHAGEISEIWALISLGPFLVCVLRYLLLIDQSKTEKPEEAIFDPILIAAATGWLVAVSIGIFI